MTLLYRAQHPARYEGRLRTIPSSDVELKLGQSRVCWGAVAPGRLTAVRSVRVTPARRASTADRRERRPPDRVRHIV
jgi:hypothetical protein